MSLIELNYVDADTPETDGHVIVQRDPLNYPDPIHTNAHLDLGQTYSHTGTGVDPNPEEEWWETRTLTMFDFSEIKSPYIPKELTLYVRFVNRSLENPATFECFAYPGLEIKHPFDLNKINPYGSWGDLSGHPTVINPLDFDSWIEALGGSDSADGNYISFTSDEAPKWRFNLRSTRWAENKQGSAAGVVWAQRMEYPAQPDPAFTDQFDPSNTVRFERVRLIIDVGGEEVELEGFTVQLSLSLEVDIQAKPLFHRAKREKYYRR